VDLSEISKQVPSHIAVQGNLNPELLNGPLSSLEPAVNHLLDAMQDRPGFIFNLGHGIEPTAHGSKMSSWLVEHVQKQKVH
jgi:uroporphyrinogen decarboxylase